MNTNQEAFEKIVTIPEYAYFRNGTYSSSSGHSDHCKIVAKIRNEWEGFCAGRETMKEEVQQLQTLLDAGFTQPEKCTTECTNYMGALADADHFEEENKDLTCSVHRLRNWIGDMCVQVKWNEESALKIIAETPVESLTRIRKQVLLAAVELINDPMGPRSFNNCTGKKALDSAIESLNYAIYHCENENG